MIVWMAVVMSGLALVLSIVLIISLIRVMKLTSQLKAGLSDLRQNGEPIVGEVRRTLELANSDLERMGAVLGATELVGGTVASTLRVAHNVAVEPVIQAKAVQAGGSAAISKMREGSSERAKEFKRLEKKRRNKEARKSG